LIETTERIGLDIRPKSTNERINHEVDL